VFNPLTHAYCSLLPFILYRRHEQVKKRGYDQCFREVEHGCFSPLILSASGGMGPISKVVYNKLASMVATRCNESYSQAINWLQCRLSFSLLCSSIMCKKGSHCTAGIPQLREATIYQAIYQRKL